MRQVLDDQKYLNFTPETSLKVVADYRAKYSHIDECLDANGLILWLVHEDLASLSTSTGGRGATYTTENLFRALLVHQIEGTSLRDTVIRIAESPTLQTFIRLGNRSVMDFTFLNRAFKAITPETWKLVNEELAQYAAKTCEVDVSQIRTDSTVIEANIHYPTDSSLLWDSYRVLSRLLRAVRDEAPELCPHRFHDKKAKNDLVYVHRYMRSKSKPRRQEMMRRYRRLLEAVRRLQDIAAGLTTSALSKGNVTVMGLRSELKHYLPLTRQVCQTAERAGLKGETVPARERIFSIFEEHTELIKRGKSGKPVEFGHTMWLAQTPQKFITDYDTMEEKVPDSELLNDIIQRHRTAFRKYPTVIAADTGFRAGPEEMAVVEKHVEIVAVPGRGLSRVKIDKIWHNFRAGIEGSISVLKRAFRLSICMYRGFKSFAAAIGMAVFCHNLVTLSPRRRQA